jgi:hypothetical protein
MIFPPVVVVSFPFPEKYHHYTFTFLEDGFPPVVVFFPFPENHQ